MAKLHELLACEQSVQNQANVCRADLISTFEKKQNHFIERVQTFKSSVEGEPDRQESQLSLQTTVSKELQWIGDKLAAAMDVGHQIDVANTLAKADIVLENGTILLKDVPSTSLLQIEKRLQAVLGLVQAIPTLDPSKGYAPDPSRGAGIYRARDDERPRTKKEFRFIVMVAPTDKHPAQVKELTEDKEIGRVITQEWSAVLPVVEKGNMLDRCEALIRAVRKARSRANDFSIEPKENKIGQRLLDYVFFNTK